MDGNRIVASWEVFELSNDDLALQRAYLEDEIAKGTASGDALREILVVVRQEMQERGVAYELSAKLSRLSSTSRSSLSATPAAEVCSPKPLASSARLKFDELFGLRPPWYVTGPAHAADAEVSMPTVWDDADEHSSKAAGGGNVPPLQPESDDECLAASKRQGRQRGRVGYMNKLGFFVVAQRRRKKSRPSESAPPAVAAKKPPLPPVRTKKAGPLTVAGAGTRINNTSSLKAARGLPPRSVSAIPTDQRKQSPAGRVGVVVPLRPATAEPMKAEIITDTREEQGEVRQEPAHVLVLEHTNVQSAQLSHSPISEASEPPEDAGEKSLNGVDCEVQPVPKAVDVAPPSVSITDDLEAVCEAPAAVNLPNAFCETTEGTCCVTSAMWCDALAKEGREGGPGDVEEGPQCVPEEVCKLKLSSCPPSEAPVEHETRGLQPPVRDSLYALMVDPSLLFSYDTQPSDVQFQALKLLQETLHVWFGIPLSSDPHQQQKKVKTLPVAAKHKTLRAQSSNDSTSEDMAHVREDKHRWYLVQTSHEEVYELVSGVLDSLDNDDFGEWMEVPDPAVFWGEQKGQEILRSTRLSSSQVPPLWSLWWTWGKPRVQQASVWLWQAQYVNHIPKSWNLTRKDALSSNVQRYASKQHGAAFAIVPATFHLPQQYVAFCTAFAELKGVWIMKTIGMSRGRGITLVSDISDVVYDAPVVIQRYVDRPLTIDGGYKFDLRLYVLVTSFQPKLEAFISKLGFARIAACRYPKSGGLTQRYAHLTNTSVSHEAKAAARGGDAMRTDTKWTLQQLEQYMDRQRNERRWQQVWECIKDCVRKALVCVEDVIPAAPCTFELFGFDVLLDEDYRPWVLEVNASPSLEVDSAQDEDVKPKLIDDVVTLLNIPKIDRWALLRAVDRRLKPTKPSRSLTTSKQHSSAPLGEADEDALWRSESASIFGSWTPRRLGVDPVPEANLGDFEVLSPHSSVQQLRRIKHSV